MTVIEARSLTRRYGGSLALDDVSLEVAAGEIHALLGPNGAGKTTLLRILAGLLTPSEGVARIAGIDTTSAPRSFHQLIGLVPANDRTFYLRISGLENLVFFARLHGLRRKAATNRAREVLAAVDLAGEADKRVGLYSHGMQKRLSMARALLADPPVMFVDEATHDLDPAGAERVRALARDASARGTTVLWTTQRVDEIRGFAKNVTLLDGGKVRFAGTVPALIAQASPQRWLLRLQNGREGGDGMAADLQSALGDAGRIADAGSGDGEHYLLSLSEGVALGDALARLSMPGVSLLSCREERSEVESAFLSLTDPRPT